GPLGFVRGLNRSFDLCDRLTGVIGQGCSKWLHGWSPLTGHRSITTPAISPNTIHSNMFITIESVTPKDTPSRGARPEVPLGHAGQPSAATVVGEWFEEARLCSNPDGTPKLERADSSCFGSSIRQIASGDEARTRNSATVIGRSASSPKSSQPDAI